MTNTPPADHNHLDCVLLGIAAECVANPGASRAELWLKAHAARKSEGVEVGYDEEPF